jgi:hypothetical protein
MDIKQETFGIYGDMGVLSSEVKKMGGTGALLDETNELVLLRAFASKLLACLGGELNRNTFIAHMTKNKGARFDEACGAWDRFEQSGFKDMIAEYVQCEFVDKNTSAQLVKVLGEIRSIIKQIEEGNRKDSKHIKLEDLGELIVSINQHVEKQLLKIGGKQDAVHEWRKWFKATMEDFQARNAKGGK